MKKLFLAIILLGMGINLKAQYSSKVKEMYGSSYGVKASIGSIVTRPEITYVGNEIDYVIHEIELINTQPQYSFGAFGRKKFGWLYTDVTAMYSAYGMNYQVTSYVEEGAPVKTMSEKFGYLDLQVMGGLTRNGFRMAVGPVMHILANHSSELEDLYNYNQKLRSISYGFSGSVGYDLGRFSFDLKYDKAFRTVGDHIYYGNKKSLFLETPDAINVTVSYALIKS